MKSALNGVAVALTIMAATLPAKGDGSPQGGHYVLVWQPDAGVASPVSIPVRDNSAEIILLQNRLWRLRMELEDARADLKMAIAQGTGWVTANMRVMTIMRAISDCERRLMQLR